MAEREKLIELKDLQITFGSGKKKFVAVDHVNFDIYKGETFSLVGESGSGKTTIGRAICRINPTSGGDILFKGHKINGKISKELDQEVIRKIQMIFQDPMASLNERAKVEYIVAEGLLNHHLYKDQDDLHNKVMDALHEVGLLPEFASRFPHEFSGGMRQRIVIAIALSCQPKILICDEPTTALDVTIQAQILKLIKDLQHEFGYTIVFITHDLGVVANVADRVAVLYAGQIVELGTVEDVFYDPRHPYTWAMLSSLPQLAQRNTELYSITGTPPSLYNKIVGDPFAPRNPYCLKIDTIQDAPMFKVSDTHYAKTWLLDPRAPKIEKPEAIRNLHEKLVEAFNI